MVARLQRPSEKATAGRTRDAAPTATRMDRELRIAILKSSDDLAYASRRQFAVVRRSRFNDDRRIYDGDGCSLTTTLPRQGQLRQPAGPGLFLRHRGNGGEEVTRVKLEFSKNNIEI
ncbi:hypothetical protein TIFTF001_023080 [Ficus carica]|uniref:Uncharacterized protein n=1 Tax=Ficus carica TaxID=3494 RepID=A0AA88AWI3_FICCA|nr:hypothetical protein TIFTF001_023080 [Ficus carica]